jgi:hypothetical protein
MVRGRLKGTCNMGDRFDGGHDAASVVVLTGWKGAKLGCVPRGGEGGTSFASIGSGSMSVCVYISMFVCVYRIRGQH